MTSVDAAEVRILPETVIAFDLYGTILSTASIGNRLTSLYGKDKAASIAANARVYQLEYTWRINSMQGDSSSNQPYYDFDKVTRWSFQHAAKDVGVSITPEDEDTILNAYNSLDPFEDAIRGIQHANAVLGTHSFIFSNGTPDMLSASLSTSPGLANAGISFRSDRIISVDDFKVFKPDPRVYHHLREAAQKVDPEAEEINVWVVSSNPFDVVGAVSAGLKAVWVSRGKEWVDGLGKGAGHNPTIIVDGVDDAIFAIRRGGRV